MNWFNKSTFVLIFFMAATIPVFPSVQRVALKETYRMTVERLVKGGNLDLLGRLFYEQIKRAEHTLPEEHLNDVGILRGAYNAVYGSINVQQIEQKYAPVVDYWVQLERLHAYRNNMRTLFLKSVMGRERIAFENVMFDNTLTVAQLEKARSLYKQENSLKCQAMAEWLSVKIDSKKLKAELAAVNAVINKKEAQSTRLHALDAIDEHVKALFFKRDWERKQGQLDCLYAALKK